MQLLAVSRDVSAPWKAEAFQAGQHQVLEMIATGAPLAQVLTLLVHLIEDQCEGTGVFASCCSTRTAFMYGWGPRRAFPMNTPSASTGSQWARASARAAP